MELETRFLNVDLDVESAHDLSPLVDEFAPIAFNLHHAAMPHGFRASFELDGAERLDADTAIQRLADAVLRLPPAGRQLWDSATARRFSIGIAAGLRPYSFHVILQPGTVSAVAGVGAAVEVVVYGANTGSGEHLGDAR